MRLWGPVLGPEPNSVLGFMHLCSVSTNMAHAGRL